ncbi:hypothetical protein AVEN_217362-1 [Araneus ventricosus]|uniref:Uncharacterized protein n=1 Tax=Araneus ventricosus TaxID=182803 RepID=A0A4Y2S5L0_ARAVE|nr:hypothetical protein AVEN_217362-1 [Araneus ventricosus]
MAINVLIRITKLPISTSDKSCFLFCTGGIRVGIQPRQLHLLSHQPAPVYRVGERGVSAGARLCGRPRLLLLHGGGPPVQPPHRRLQPGHRRPPAIAGRPAAEAPQAQPAGVGRRALREFRAQPARARRHRGPDEGLGALLLPHGAGGGGLHQRHQGLPQGGTQGAPAQAHHGSGITVQERGECSPCYLKLSYFLSNQI